MNKKIRSISISDEMDKKLTNDSQTRGLTISANISRILFDYFQDNNLPQQSGIRLPVKNR